MVDFPDFKEDEAISSSSEEENDCQAFSDSEFHINFIGFDSFETTSFEEGGIAAPKTNQRVPCKDF